MTAERSDGVQEFRRRLRALVNSRPNAGRPPAAEAVRKVLRAGVDSTERLEAAAPDPSVPPDAAAAACWLLGVLRTDGAEDALIAALDHADLSVRLQAAISLATLRSTAAIPRLLDALRGSEDADVRRVAVYALGEIRDRRAIEPLIRILESGAEPTAIRAQAAESLSTLGAREAVPELLRRLHSEDAELRFWAVHALGKLGAAGVLSELRSVAERDHAEVERWGAIQSEAREAIRAIEWREAHA